ncbi:MAG TPA: DUF952 domain-containing protein [Pseudolabrys sp.]|nr:DUF952 domain-containing protein [Pseudolabrys sp.]
MSDGQSGTRPKVIYKICPAALWREAEAAGVFHGSAVDRESGFIHFSTAAQVAATAKRHFARKAGLLLLGVAVSSLGNRLKWEPSRGGDLFPHLYGPLIAADVLGVDPLPLGPDGLHRFPPLDD